MENYRSPTNNDSDTDEEYTFHNPFLLEDDKFEKEFEKTLALFDALLIGEDSLSDTFSICSPESKLTFDKTTDKAASGGSKNTTGKLRQTSSKRKIVEIPNPVVESSEEDEERPKSFLHDEVSEFNRLLKELSQTPSSFKKHSSSTLDKRDFLTERNPFNSRHHHHHYSSSISLPLQPQINDVDNILIDLQTEDTGSINNNINNINNINSDFEAESEDMLNVRVFKKPDESKLLLDHISSPNKYTRDVTSSPDTWSPSSSPSRSRSTGTLYQTCQNSLSAKRKSCKEILESGFFESLKSLQCLRFVGTDEFGYRRFNDASDRGSYSLNFGNKRFGEGDHGCLSVQEDPSGNTTCLTGHICNKEEPDSAYQTGNSDTLTSSTSSLSSVPNVLRISESCLMRSLGKLNLQEKLAHFNTSKHGLYMEMSETNCSIYQGTIRVHMNLTQPISMRLTPATSCPPSDGDHPREFPSPVNDQDSSNYDSILRKKVSSNQGIIGSESEITRVISPDLPHSSPEQSNQYASFYLPVGVSKVIHCTSESTTSTVIKILLNKFHIVDTVNKFALFQKTFDKSVEDCNVDDLSRPLTCHMRKLGDDERPLEISLKLIEEPGLEILNRVQFVLQEYSSGEIIWDAFSIPELNNFVMILDREEQIKLNEVKQKYAEVENILKKQIVDFSSNTTSC